MAVLKRGDRGDAVETLQIFLTGKGFDPQGVDGIFGEDTEAAVRAFQEVHGLAATGRFDRETEAKARSLGMPDAAPSIASVGSLDRNGPDWPAKPDFPPLVGTAARQAIFGAFAFVHEPVPGNFENIRVTDGWAQANIVPVVVPELRGVDGAPGSGRIFMHRLVADQTRALWSAWDRAGLRPRVLTWAGSYVPRLVRGGASLSNHAFGTAFDINVKWNGLGAVPALLGKEGCVRELVEIAHAHGFYWGGHFTRRDGMHFEVAKVM